MASLPPVLPNWWLQNQFMMPGWSLNARNPTQVVLPVLDQGLLQTANYGTPDWLGSDGGKGGTKGNGAADLNQGPADIGYSKGGATADTTTTATDSTRDFAASLVGGLMATVAPGALTGLSLASQMSTGKGLLGNLADTISDLFSGTPNPANAKPGQDLSYGPSEASGFADYGTANAPDPNAPGVGTNQVGQANDPYGGATGLGQGGGDVGSAK